MDSYPECPQKIPWGFPLNVLREQEQVVDLMIAVLDSVSAVSSEPEPIFRNQIAECDSFSADAAGLNGCSFVVLCRHSRIFVVSHLISVIC